MGQEKLDTIVETLKRFKKNQKNLENRITKLTEICRDRFKKVEKGFIDKYQAQEKKLVAHDEEVLIQKKEEIFKTLLAPMGALAPGLKPHTKFQNPMIIPSGRKVTWRREER
jgi:hypothetical protein